MQSRDTADQEHDDRRCGGRVSGVSGARPRAIDPSQEFYPISAFVALGSCSGIAQWGRAVDVEPVWASERHSALLSMLLYSACVTLRN